MKRNAKEIIDDALALEPTARAYVAEVLLESLDHEDDFAVSTEWRAEIQQRCTAIDAGAVELLDGEQVLQELRKHLQ